MNTRIKKLRKELDLTQQKFADRIGTTANVLTNYETGRRNPSSSVINNICKTFGVNETWLRTGEGEMFTNEPDTVLDALAAKYGLSSSARALVEEFVNLPPDIQQAFVDYALKAARAIATDDNAAMIPEPPAAAPRIAAVPARPVTDADIEEQVERCRQQLLLEKRMETSQALTPDMTG